MTLWARTYEFQLLFGENWSVNLEEYESDVEYTIMANEGISIDLESSKFNEYHSFLTGVGAEEVEFMYEDSKFGFRLRIPKNRLPNDYDDTIEDMN